MNRTRHQRKAFGRLIKKLGIATGIIKAADNSAFFRTWLVNLQLKDPPSEPEVHPLPLKHIRLAQLVEAGFNCPHYISGLRGNLDSSSAKVFLEKHGSVSVRCFRQEIPGEATPKLPFKYGIDDWNKLAGLCSELNADHHILVNEYLPLEDSLMAGNIILLDPERYVVSYFEGYGTPRDVDDKPELKVYLRPFDKRAPSWAPHLIEEVIGQLRLAHMQFSPVQPKTFEFSIYPYPVGMQKKPLVFWEWRSGSAHDLYTIVARMLKRAHSHELIFNLPRIAV